MPRAGMTPEEIQQCKDRMLGELDSLIEREKRQGIRDDFIYSHCKNLFNMGLCLTPDEYNAYIRYVCKKIPY